MQSQYSPLRRYGYGRWLEERANIDVSWVVMSQIQGWVAHTYIPVGGAGIRGGLTETSPKVISPIVSIWALRNPIYPGVIWTRAGAWC